jgi:hypothetical protein
MATQEDDDDAHFDAFMVHNSWLTLERHVRHAKHTKATLTGHKMKRRVAKEGTTMHLQGRHAAGRSCSISSKSLLHATLLDVTGYTEYGVYGHRAYGTDGMDICG